MQEARLIIQKNMSAAENMSADEALLEYAVSRPDNFLPVLRLYSWCPAGVSLGYFQKLEKEINLENCKKYGVDVVRRPTGGKAVLHDDELTYCFVFKTRPTLDWTILDAFKKINEALTKGMRGIGIPCELIPFRYERAGAHTAVCFAAPSSYEIKINNKKVIGSAQTRRGDFILQHGSVPVTIDRRKLYDLFNFKTEEEKIKQRAESENIMTSLTEGTPGVKLDFESLAQAVKTGFEEVWNFSFKEGKLNTEEEGIKKRLEEFKYGTDGWNWNKAIKV